MTTNTEDSGIPAAWPTAAVEHRSLRTWPAVVLVILLWATRILPGMLEELPFPLLLLKFMGPAAISALILLWWVGFSRAAWWEKLFGLVGVVLVAVVTSLLADESLRGVGTMIYAVPWGITVFAVALIVGAKLPAMRRVGLSLLASLIAFGYWDLVRTDGVWGDFHATHSWRWEATAEDRFLDQLASRSTTVDDAEIAFSEPLVEPEWPEFRGPDRRGVQPGIVLNEDWTAHPPREI